FARAAVEIALHDLAGRLAGLPVHALLGGKLRDRVPLTYALSIDAPDAMARTAASSPECSSFKVKIAGEVGPDTERVRAVAAARPDADLWLDANQSYSPPRLAQLLAALHELPRLFCIEQPVRSVDWFGLRQARERSPLPLAV